MGGRSRILANPYDTAYAKYMKTIPATRARANLYRLIDDVVQNSEPVQITGPRSEAVLVSADDWRSIQETLYLLSIPGMRESILEGIAAPSSECVEELDW